MGELPLNGDYFSGLSTVVPDGGFKTVEEKMFFNDQFDRAMKRPWTRRDYPHLAVWLTGNEKPLALAVDASKRSHYYRPVSSPRSNSSKPGEVSFDSAVEQQCRNVMNALIARAMLCLGEGKHDAAWQNLLAVHRLARLVGSGPTHVDFVIGAGMDVRVSNAELAFAQHAKLSLTQWRDRFEDLQALPAFPAIADTLDLGERLKHLDALQSFQRGDLSEWAFWLKVPEKLDAKLQTRNLEQIDWSLACREGNKWFDRAVACVKINERPEREKKLDRFDTDVKAILKFRFENMSEELESIKKTFLELTLPAEPDKQLGKEIGDMLIAMNMPIVHKEQYSRDRLEQHRLNVQIAVALAAYRLDKARYPAKLDDLVPNCLATVPLDVFTGKPLTYRPNETGYLLYSVGPNGRDETGRGIKDQWTGDDIIVRMPLPDLPPVPDYMKPKLKGPVAK